MISPLLSSHVENIVCDAVNTYIAVNNLRTEPVEPSVLFKFNRGRDRFVIAMARQLVLYVLHDRYFVSYSKLKKYSGMAQDKHVMRSVCKARSFVLIDAVYRSVYNSIKERLYGE